MRAPLRIRKPGERVPRSGAPGAGFAGSDSYVERLTKLIPAEVVTAYVIGREIAADNAFAGEWTLICFGATIVFRALLTWEPPDRGAAGSLQALRHVQWPAVLLSSVSFLLWAFTLGDSLPAPLPSLPQWAASLVLLLWTPLVPLVYRGSPAALDPAA